MSEQDRYQHCRPLTEDEYQALKADIEQHGVLEYVHVDEDGAILVGHHRARAASELGIDYPRHVIHGLSEQQKHEYAVRLESLGRSRDMDTKQWTALNLWNDSAVKLSQARIAELVGTAPSVVHKWIDADRKAKAAEATSDPASGVNSSANLSPDEAPTVEDSIGRQRPRTYKKSGQNGTAATPAPEPETAVVGDVMSEIADELEASGAFERVEAEKQARRARSIRLTLLEIVSAYPPGVLAEGLDSDELGQLVADLDALLAWTEQAKQVTQQARRPRRIEA